jgi:hypothetical protein
MKHGIIYLITNLVTGMKYVGLTSNSHKDMLGRRFNEHCKLAKKGKGSKLSLQEAIRQDGEKNFTITKIHEYYEQDSLDFWTELGNLEEHYIKQYNSTVSKLGGTGYNQTKGGKYSGGGGKVPILVNDILFKSWADACKHFGHDENTPRNRIKAGWSIDDAFMIPAYEWDNSVPFKMNMGEPNEIEYPSLKKACEIFSLKYRTVWLHMDTHNLTPEEALKYFLAKREKWTHQGVWYKSAESAIDSEPECNLSPAAVLSRIRRGMTLTEALTTPRKSFGPKTGPTARKSKIQKIPQQQLEL